MRLLALDLGLFGFFNTNESGGLRQVFEIHSQPSGAITVSPDGRVKARRVVCCIVSLGKRGGSVCVVFLWCYEGLWVLALKPKYCISLVFLADGGST